MTIQHRPAPRRESFQCNTHPNSSIHSPRPLRTEPASAPLSPLPPPDRPLPQLFTRTALSPLLYPRRSDQYPTPPTPTGPTPTETIPGTASLGLTRSESTTNTRSKKQNLLPRRAGQRLSEPPPPAHQAAVGAGQGAHIKYPSLPSPGISTAHRHKKTVERSKSASGLPELNSLSTMATPHPPPPSKNNNNPRNTNINNTSRSMAAIYQLVSTRAKPHPASSSTLSRDPSSHTAIHSLHHAPSFAGSEATSFRTGYSGSSCFSSVPSLATSLSSTHSVALSSCSSSYIDHTSSNPTGTELNNSSAYYVANPTPPSSVSSKLSLRSSSAAAFNKSLHSLLRRRKLKPASSSSSETPGQPADLSLASPVPAALHIPRPGSRSAAAPSPNCHSALPFAGFPRNNNSDPTKECSRASEESDGACRAQTTIISGSLIVASDTGLAGTHGRARPAKPEGGPDRRPSSSSDEDSEMDEMIRTLRGIAIRRKGPPALPLPATQKSVDPQQQEEEDEDDEEEEEMDSMMKNLCALAGTRCGSASQHAGAETTAGAPAQAEEDEEEMEYGSDTDEDSESSFEADVLDCNHFPAQLDFPLPSWPKLDSTSQSPFTQQSLDAPAFRPAECSVSLSLP
ncbi:hypothetical protein PGT21_027064 [Puccinia graminis f. sp. tritici]|uniref:Uncharacterized protein n=1 Tax=Puccinia graminis f. sp. tritici TaxID=56615 RepID=A0A5B0NMA2_PUCGR|nr:hypothetical protein PGT21_027064 [Puccinia graminis f. sp. tritici]